MVYSSKRFLSKNRRMLPLLFLIILIALYFYPINSTVIRLLVLVDILLLLFSAIYALWVNRAIRYVIIFVSIALLIFPLLPGRDYNRFVMRKQYIMALESYEGTKYVWGGENSFGIDCSGLMRRALIVADIKRGLLHPNPTLVRDGLSLWWNDTSAKTLMSDDYPMTVTLFTYDSINKIDEHADITSDMASMVMPGDMAVTSNGVHVMANIGPNKWIEADPNVGQVIVVNTPSDIGWFKTPVKIVRWRQLEFE